MQSGTGGVEEHCKLYIGSFPEPKDKNDQIESAYQLHTIRDRKPASEAEATT